jgi:hypothetical protein
MKMWEKNKQVFDELGISKEDAESSMTSLIEAGFAKVDDEGHIYLTMPDTGEVVGFLPTS